MKRITLILLMSLVLVGCVTTTKLSKENELKVKEVSINEDVKIPEKAFYHGPAQSAGMAFGLIGALVASVASTADERIVEYMKANDINIAQIVKLEFEKQLINHPKFIKNNMKIDQDEYDAEFSLVVTIYGIAQVHGFSSVYRPTLGITVILADLEGNVLWKDNQYLTAHNDAVEAIEFEQFFSDPEIMTQKFTERAQNVVSLLMKEF